MGATSALFFSALARLAHFLPWSAACLFTMTLPKRGGTARAIMSEMNRKCLILNTLIFDAWGALFGAIFAETHARVQLQLPAGRRRYPIFLHLEGARTMARPRLMALGRRAKLPLRQRDSY